MKMIALGDVADLIMGQFPPGETYNTLGDAWPFFQGKTEFGKVSPIPVLSINNQKKLISRFSQFNKKMVLIKKSRGCNAQRNQPSAPKKSWPRPLTGRAKQGRSGPCPRK